MVIVANGLWSWPASQGYPWPWWYYHPRITSIYRETTNFGVHFWTNPHGSGDSMVPCGKNLLAHTWDGHGFFVASQICSCFSMFPPRPPCGLVEAHIGCGSTDWCWWSTKRCGRHSHNPPSTCRQATINPQIIHHQALDDGYQPWNAGSWLRIFRNAHNPWLGQVSSRNWKKRCATSEATLTAREWMTAEPVVMCWFTTHSVIVTNKW